MPTPAEFEEKEYEFALYVELALSRQIWTPGQVLEAELGFDAALRAGASFWRHVGRTSLPGVALTGASLGLPRTKPLASAAAPTFDANVFVQAKRSTWYTRRPMALNGRPNAPTGCYAFDVYVKPGPYAARNRNQQTRLETLARRLGPRAAVCYAAPAFSTRDELFRALRFGRVMSSSSFPDVGVLAGHDQWVYVRPGRGGWACSDPIEVSDAPLPWERDGLSVDGASRGRMAANLVGLAQRVRDAFLEATAPADPQEQEEEEEEGWWASDEHAWVERIFEGDTADPAEVVARVAAVTARFGILWFVPS